MEVPKIQSVQNKFKFKLFGLKAYQHFMVI